MSLAALMMMTSSPAVATGTSYMAAPAAQYNRPMYCSAGNIAAGPLFARSGPQSTNSSHANQSPAPFYGAALGPSTALPSFYASQHGNGMFHQYSPMALPTMTPQGLPGSLQANAAFQLQSTAPNTQPSSPSTSISTDDMLDDASLLMNLKNEQLSPNPSHVGPSPFVASSSGPSSSATAPQAHVAYVAAPAQQNRFSVATISVPAYGYPQNRMPNIYPLVHQNFQRPVMPQQPPHSAVGQSTPKVATSFPMAATNFFKPTAEGIQRGIVATIASHQALRTRVNFAPHELRVMEKVFDVEPVPSPETRKRLSQQLNVPQRRIQVWFQNRRARTKSKKIPLRGSSSSTAASSEADQEPDVKEEVKDLVEADIADPVNE